MKRVGDCRGARCEGRLLFGEENGLKTVEVASHEHVGRAGGRERAESLGVPAAETLGSDAGDNIE